jgi:valyl-tRNA synthetase
MALLIGAAPGTDIVFSPERLDSARAFANKIWNAARFILSNDSDDSSEAGVEDRWIRSRLNECARQMDASIAAYRYHEAAQAIWHFIWDDFCDWYIELKKIRGGWQRIREVFEETLHLLHPLMPFITEELWHRFGEHGDESISLRSYPSYDPKRDDPAAEAEIELLQNIVRAARNLKTDLGIDVRQPVTGKISIGIDNEMVRRLCAVTFTQGEVPKTGAVRSTTDFDLSLDVPAGQLEAQRKRVDKEREQLTKNIANSQRQLSDEVFLSKAPAKVIDSIRAKLAEYEAQLEKLNAL